MKRIRRPDVQLPTLQPAGIGGKEATRRETLFNTSQNLGEVNTEFATYWGNADVRGALWAMHGRTCVYCDRELPEEHRGDVEHFRPKSIYWWLAYKFENYLLACSACNSAYKGEKFPLLPRRKPYNYSLKNKLARERRALVDPVSDVTDGWFGIDFTADWKSEGFQITISPGIGRIETRRCEETRKFFKLNVDSGLARARLLAIHTALNLIEKANAGDLNSENELRKRAVRFSPHSFAIRQVIRLKGRPEYLPSYDQEVEWLIDDLIEVLRFAIRGVAQDPGNTSEQNRRDRSAWALAVLMKDPPALSTEAIRTRLAADNVLTVVEPLYNLI